MYYLSNIGFLREFKDLQKYYAKQFFAVLYLPIFNFIVFFIRFAGIINSINTDSAWKTTNLTDERKAFVSELVNELKGPVNFLGKIRGKVNNGPENW